MKRSLLILVATAAVWTGCSKTETIDQPQGMAIGFTNAYIGNPVESKAVGIIDQNNINEFLVYGGYNDNDTCIQWCIRNGNGQYRRLELYDNTLLGCRKDL